MSKKKEKPTSTLKEFLGVDGNEEHELTQLRMHCNALYITEESINLYLTPLQALRMASSLTRKAEMLLRNQIEDPAIQVWGGKTKSGGSLKFGIVPAVKKNERDP
jgi:hypothetical protein